MLGVENNSPLVFVLAALVAAGLVGFILFLNWTDRNRIRRLFESEGGRVISLYRREGPTILRVLLQQTATHWDVVYINAEGQRRKATCTALMLRCIVDSDEPADQKPPKSRPK